MEFARNLEFEMNLNWIWIECEWNLAGIRCVEIWLEFETMHIWIDFELWNLEWSGMELNGMGLNRMEWNGMEWNWKLNGMESQGTHRNGMEWNGMEWNWMEFERNWMESSGIECIFCNVSRCSVGRNWVELTLQGIQSNGMALSWIELKGLELNWIEFELNLHWIWLNLDGIWIEFEWNLKWNSNWICKECEWRNMREIDEWNLNKNLKEIWNEFEVNLNWF